MELLWYRYRVGGSNAECGFGLVFSERYGVFPFIFICRAFLYEGVVSAVRIQIRMVLSEWKASLVKGR